MSWNIGVAAILAGSMLVSQVTCAGPKEELEHVHAQWIKAINVGNKAEGLEFMAPDAAIVGAQGDIAVGHDEVVARISELTRWPGFHVEFTLTRTEISADGLVGFVVGDSVITVAAQDGKKTNTRHRLLTVWRQDSSGHWRCYLDLVMPAQPGSEGAHPPNRP